MNFDAFTMKQLQECKILLGLVDPDMTVFDLIKHLEKELHNKKTEMNKPMPTVKLRSCPSCDRDMILKTADDEKKLVYWECPNCWYSVFEEKKLKDYQIEE